MSSNGLGRFALLASVTVAAFALAVPTATAATPGPQVPCTTDTDGATGQQVQLCASFGKTSYRSSEAITVTLTVTNLSDTPADGISVFLDGDSRSFAMPSSTPFFVIGKCSTIGLIL